MNEPQIEQKPLSAWIAIPLIIFCLAGGGWMAHWYISTDQLTHESTILDATGSAASTRAPARNNRTPAADTTPPIGRQDANSNIWWVHSREAAAQIDSAGKGQPITVKAVNYNSYQFVPQEQRNMIFAARRIGRDETVAKNLKLTEDQIKQLRSLTGTIGMSTQQADVDLLSSLWGQYQNADQPADKLAVQTKLVDALTEIARKSVDPTKAAVADRAAKIKAVLTDDQWKQFDAMGK
jgi:hypothetical protein